MRLTIERLRTMVLAAGVLLIAALVVFLAVGRIRSHFNAREMPKRLGVNIQAEANGITYSHALGAHEEWEVHASKAEQLKNGQVLLHKVVIELNGQDGSHLDRIEGNEFTLDQKSGVANALGPVEITLLRPMIAPAIAPKASPNRGVTGKVSKPLASAAEAAASGEIKVETSGLTSNWNTGVTSTDQRVNFSLKQGAGSSMGASFDSQNGILVLNREVELTTNRAGETVHIRAQHAEFTRDELTCQLRQATAEYRGGQAAAAQAKVLFREDGSAIRLDATDGFSLATSTGGHLAAPTGSMVFDEHNLPHHGHLDGGVRMDSVNDERQVHGTSSAADLEFTPRGELRHAHLEREVNFTSETASGSATKSKNGAAPELVRTTRTWRSPVADVDFRPSGKGQVDPASLHGKGGVVVTSEMRRGNALPVPSRLAADELDGQFGSGSMLSTLTGTGHASIAETTKTGAKQNASGDRLEAHFAPGDGTGLGASSGNADQIQSAILDGHVTLIQEPAPKPGATPQPPMHATAGKAVYEGAGEWLHLQENPRVEDGDMQLAADAIDVSQKSGDAFAHGNVKGTWLDEKTPGQANTLSHGSLSIGGSGLAHVVAQEAHIERATDQATFKGNARLWQQDNSIAAPLIVLNQQKKTLAATSADPAQPVRVVMLSTGGAEGASPARKQSKPTTPSVIRVRGGDLLYSDAARKALMAGGPLGPVVAETATATSVSNQVELYLLPPGAHAASGQGQVDHMIATGHVLLTTQQRRGAGEQLTYSSNTGEYVLTGTPSAPPHFVDPERGNVTGTALIFHSRDDSVSIEGGGGHETRTETTVRPIRGKSEPQK